DDLLKAIGSSGGVVMVNYVPGFVSEKGRLYANERQKEEERLEKIHGDDEAKVDAGIDAWRELHPAPKITLSDVADHIDYIRKIAGVDSIGIGADYEGFGHPPQGLEDVSTYPALLAELLRRGYADDEIKKIAGLNLLRVMRAAEKVSKESKETK